MEKKRKRKKLDSLFIKGLLFVFFCAVGIGILGQVKNYERLKEESTIIAAEIKKEQDRQLEFESQKEYYNSDSYIEQIAREQLSMIKPNEILYVNKGQ